MGVGQRGFSRRNPQHGALEDRDDLRHSVSMRCEARASQDRMCQDGPRDTTRDKLDEQLKTLQQRRTDRRGS